MHSAHASPCQFEPGYTPETDTQQLRSDIDVTLSAMSTERVVKLPLEPKNPPIPGVRASVAEATDNPVSSRGFRAQLSDMTLADLIQMKCLSGAHECFRVKSSLRQGILVFDAGHVVHARTGHLEGDAAVFAMLAWETGSIQPEVMPPELRRSVKSGWQSLLMHAAQARDEGRELVSREAAGSRESLAVDVEWEEEMKGLQHQDSMLRRLGFSPAVHIDAEGTVIERIGDTEELESVVALATRLANLAGEELGLDALNAFEARVGSRVCIVYQDRDGSFFGILADGHDDLSELRKSLNL